MFRLVCQSGLIIISQATIRTAIQFDGVDWHFELPDEINLHQKDYLHRIAGD